MGNISVPAILRKIWKINGTTLWPPTNKEIIMLLVIRLKDPQFRESQFENDRTETACIQMDEIAQKDFSQLYDASRVLSIQKEVADFFQEFWKTWTRERSFWLQRRVDRITPSTPRIWRTTTLTSAILEVSKMAPIIEFFFQLVTIERFPVDSMIIEKESTHDFTYKGTCGTWKAVVCSLWNKSQTRDFHDLFLFCCRLIVYSWRRCAANEGRGETTTPQKNHFRSVNV